MMNNDWRNDPEWRLSRRARWTWAICGWALALAYIVGLFYIFMIGTEPNIP